LAPAGRRLKARDRIVGILLGVVLGIGIVTAFVFLGSESTIDAPRLDKKTGSGGTTTSSARQPGGGGKATHRAGPARTPVRTVEVIGGAPPASGPAHLDYHQGDRIRLRIQADGAYALEVLGYGVAATTQAGGSVPLEFTAAKRGNFPVIVTVSHIAVAQIRVE
jgi:hypothetical protein